MAKVEFKEKKLNRDKPIIIEANKSRIIITSIPCLKEVVQYDPASVTVVGNKITENVNYEIVRKDLFCIDDSEEYVTLENDNIKIKSSTGSPIRLTLCKNNKYKLLIKNCFGSIEILDTKLVDSHLENNLGCIDLHRTDNKNGHISTIRGGIEIFRSNTIGEVKSLGGDITIWSCKRVNKVEDSIGKINISDSSINFSASIKSNSGTIIIETSDIGNNTSIESIGKVEIKNSKANFDKIKVKCRQIKLHNNIWKK